MGKRQGGFTLVELMVTVAVLAILLTVAVPGMRSLVVRNSLSAKLNELVGAMQLGRSESVARSRSVSVCSSANGTSCGGSGTGWQAGWIVFADADQDGVVDTGDGDIVLHTSAAPSPGFTISGATAERFTYRSDGRVVTTGSLTVCLRTELRGTVTVDATGRPSGKKEADTTGC